MIDNDCSHHTFTDISYRELSASVLTVLERLIAFLVMVAIAIYVYDSIAFFLETPWGQYDFIYEVVSRVLLISIGVELARMLVTHSFLAVLELIGFVIARKLLAPDVTMNDILIGVLAFFALVACYRYLIFPIRQELRAENMYVTTTRIWNDSPTGADEPVKG